MEWKTIFDGAISDIKINYFGIVIILLIAAMLVYSDAYDKIFNIFDYTISITDNIESSHSKNNAKQEKVEQNMHDRIGIIEDKLNEIDYSRSPTETPITPHLKQNVVYGPNTKTLKKYLSIDFVRIEKPLKVILNITKKKTHEFPPYYDKFQIKLLGNETYLTDGRQKRYLKSTSKDELYFTFKVKDPNSPQEVTLDFGSSAIDNNYSAKLYLTIEYAEKYNPIYNVCFMTIDNISVDISN